MTAKRVFSGLAGSFGARRGVVLTLLVLVVGLAAAVVVVVAYAPPAQAAFPGKNGRIAYQSASGGADFEIYTVKPDGTSKRQVTHTNRRLDDALPSYSPDGKRIVYVQSNPYTGRGEWIYTIKASGGDRRLVTKESLYSSPSYSPDGKRIAYTAQDKDERPRDWEIYTIKVGGGGKVKVTNNNDDDFDPDYAPNGERIVYTRARGTGYPESIDHTEIYTIRADGQDKVRLTHNNSEDIQPVYSPNGKRIAYVGGAYGTGGMRDSEIFTIKASGGDKRQVAHNDAFDYGPSWGVASGTSSSAPKK